MPCNDPQKCLQSGAPDPATGKYLITFSKRSERYLYALRNGISLYPAEFPCGDCGSCRKRKAREKAILISKEAQLHEQCAFITLTYNDDHLPEGGVLVRKHWTDFAKRLRERLRELGHPPIRFFYCGEYGRRNLRPHFHAVVFGFDFSGDRVDMRQSGAHPLFRSPFLESLWIDTDTGKSLGFSSVGTVTYESAAYVSSYVVKKNTKHAKRIEALGLPPEFARGSNFLAREWLRRFYLDVYPGRGRSEVTINGKSFVPPRRFDEYMQSIDPERISEVKKLRRLDMAEKLAERSELAFPELLELLQDQKARRLARKYKDNLAIEESLRKGTL